MLYFRRSEEAAEKAVNDARGTEGMLVTATRVVIFTGTTGRFGNETRDAVEYKILIASNVL